MDDSKKHAKKENRDGVPEISNATPKAWVESHEVFHD